MSRQQPPQHQLRSARPAGGGIRAALTGLAFLLVASLGVGALGPVTAGASGTNATGDRAAEGEQRTVTDDFDRPDSDTPGRPWSELRGDWSIRDHALWAGDGPPERMVARSDTRLGATFDVEARLGIYGADGRRWNGLAFNVHAHEDGTQDYYLLRLVQATDGRTGGWQFLQVTNSTVSSEGLLDQGSIPVDGDHDYTVRVTSTSYGVFDVVIRDGERELLSRSLVAPLGRLLAGGLAGFYSSAGNLRVDQVRMTSSVLPARPHDPGPLRCTPFDGPAYELPDQHETVVGSSVVDTTWAGHQVGQSLLTHGQDQYVAYYDADRRMTVAHRRLGSDTWQRQPLDSVVGWDSHNYVTMALDRDGNLHVSGNMHVVPLVYFVTARPGDVTSLTRVDTMVDRDSEQHVTYPVFMRDPAGNLVFRYRDGSSGNGSDLYNIYDESTRTWRRLLDTPLHDGEGLRNAYVAGPTLGPDGFYHLVWVWRDTGDAATNQRLSYARSRDLVHWERSDGTPLRLPITYASGEVVDPVPMNGGIINGNTRIGFDAQGRLLISYHKYDERGNTQLYVARRDPSGWRSTRVSDWSGRWTIGGFGTLVFELTVGAVAPLPDGRLRLDFTCHGVSRTFVLDPHTLKPVAEVDTPTLPGEITAVRSDFPGMKLDLAGDLGAAPDDDSRYLLRWESLPSNQDRPRDPPLPAAQPLEVHELRR